MLSARSLLLVVQSVIDWKDDLWCVDGDVKPYSLTHSLTVSCSICHTAVSSSTFVRHRDCSLLNWALNLTTDPWTSDSAVAKLILVLGLKVKGQGYGVIISNFWHKRERKRGNSQRGFVFPQSAHLVCSEKDGVCISCVWQDTDDMTYLTRHQPWERKERREYMQILAALKREQK